MLVFVEVKEKMRRDEKLGRHLDQGYLPLFEFHLSQAGGEGKKESAAGSRDMGVSRSMNVSLKRTWPAGQAHLNPGARNGPVHGDWRSAGRVSGTDWVQYLRVQWSVTMALRVL